MFNSLFLSQGWFVKENILEQGSKLRLAGRQCDKKLSAGN